MEETLSLSETQKAVAAYLLAKMRTAERAHQEAQTEYHTYVQNAGRELGIAGPATYDASSGTFTRPSKNGTEEREDA